MVAGLAFLSKKSFNPKNLSNQKSVWEARQRQVTDEKKAKERQEQLAREQEEEELARSRYGDRGGEKASLKFMYAPPPGLAGDDKKGCNTPECPAPPVHPPSSGASDMTQRHPGDDDAAAAFRALLAGHQADAVEESQSKEYAFSNSSGAALQGSNVDRTLPSNDTRSALEKAVGRKDSGGALTLEEQVARFPQLKNAPMAKGMSATDVQVSFKPLGTQLRNVRCLACGVWGHSRGDRECSKSGWDPFAASSTLVRHIQMNKTHSENSAGDTGHKRGYSSSSSLDSDTSYERRRRKKDKKRKKEKKRRREEDRTRRKENKRRRHSSSDSEGC